MTILDSDRKILWVRSGNRCALCKGLLVEAATGDDADAIIGEEAHIVAQSDKGPRGGGLATDKVDRYANLILLCRNDHARIDKQENTYTVDKLHDIKDSHERWVESHFASEGSIKWRVRAPDDADVKPVRHITSGMALDQLIEGAAALHFDYDELIGRGEVEMVTNILQSIELFARDVAAMSVADRIQRRAALTKQLGDLNEKGFELYVGRLSYGMALGTNGRIEAASLLLKRRPGSEAILQAILEESEEETPTNSEGFEIPRSLPPDTSDIIFWNRLAEAFPGGRGLCEISNPVAAIDRLDVLLRAPLHVQHVEPEGYLRREHPIWWFRGGRTNSIDFYERLGPENCVVGDDQLHIKRVVAFRPFGVPSLYDFLYIESRAEEPVGIYEHPEGQIEEYRERWGYLDEEYALWNGRPITRAEYDDGAALIDGRPVRVKGARLRIRYITDYNFIVCGNRHVINENSHDKAMGKLLNGILVGSHTVEQLAAFILSLPKPISIRSG